VNIMSTVRSSSLRATLSLVIPFALAVEYIGMSFYSATDFSQQQRL
jgi:hypothetical protein